MKFPPHRRVLLLFFILTADPVRPAPEIYRVDPLFVTASRVPIALHSLGRTAVIIDSAAIAARAATSIGELLAGLPGIHARSRGPFGVQTDLEMAASTSSQVLLLVDGIRVNDPQTSHHSLNLPLAPTDLQRIEIVYGSTSSTHGPDAFGGVINLVPKTQVQRRLNLSSHWGRNLDDDAVAVTQETSLRYGWDEDWGKAWFSASKSLSGGYRKITQFEIDRFYLKAEVPVTNGLLHLQSGFQDKMFGANDFYAPYPSQEWTKMWLYSARYQRPFRAQGRLQGHALYRRHRDRFVLTVDNPDLYENNHVNGLGSAELFFSWGRFAAGVEGTTESIESNNLGHHHQQRFAIFSEYGRSIGPWIAGMGNRLDYSDRYGWEWSPAAGVSFVGTNRSAYGSVGRSFRAPSFTELYYTDPNHLGNGNLRAEYAVSYEAGFDFAPYPELRVHTSTFVRDEMRLVDYVRALDTPPWSVRNLGEIRTAGLQLRTDYVGSNGLHATLSYTYLTKERNLDAQLESKYVFSHPRQLLSGQVVHRLIGGLQSSWFVTLREHQAGEDYVLLDLILTRRFGDGMALLRLKNLTGQRYQEISGVPMPGRWIGIETRVDL